MTEEIIGQIFSIIGMALTVVSFQMKTKKQILMMQTAGSAFFMASYILFAVIIHPKYVIKLLLARLDRP